MEKKTKLILFSLIFLIFCTFDLKSDEANMTIPDEDKDVKVNLYSPPGIRPEDKLKEEEQTEIEESETLTKFNLQEKENQYIPLESYIDLITFKFLRGIVNIATGWGEIPRQFLLSAINDNPFFILPLGLSRGVAMTVSRTIVGVAETVLFFYSLDGTYGAVLNPAFVWQPVKNNPRKIYPPIK